MIVEYFNINQLIQESNWETHSSICRRLVTKINHINHQVNCDYINCGYESLEYVFDSVGFQVHSQASNKSSFPVGSIMGMQVNKDTTIKPKVIEFIRSDKVVAKIIIRSLKEIRESKIDKLLN